MNAQRIILAAAMGVILAACSDLATKDAPIEERSKAQSAVSTKGAATQGSAATDASATGAPASGAAIAGAQTAGTGAADVASAAPLGQGVQTHGTSTQGVEARPLPGGATPGAGDATGAAGGTAAAAGGEAATEASSAAARFAGMRSPPKDATGPLSKRLIYFDYDSSAIKEEYRDIVQAHAEFLRASKDAKSVLQGHTDERGSRDYNLALGQRRAESVQQALVLLGVEAGKLEAVSLGEEKPVKEGHDEESWSKNRRVEIYYQGE